MDEKTESTVRAPGCVVCQTIIPFFERCWSEATRDHFRNSRLEFLKGMRSLLDTRIAALSHEHAQGTHVTVE